MPVTNNWYRFFKLLVVPIFVGRKNATITMLRLNGTAGNLE